MEKVTNHYVAFQVLTAAIFWVVAPCSLVKIYRRFRNACCLHHQKNPEDGYLLKNDFSTVCARILISVTGC
jgi:hypothetical protein